MAAPHVAGIAARLIQTKGYGGQRAPNGYSLGSLGVENIRTGLRFNAFLVGPRHCIRRREATPSMGSRKASVRLHESIQ